MTDLLVIAAMCEADPGPNGTFEREDEMRKIDGEIYCAIYDPNGTDKNGYAFEFRTHGVTRDDVPFYTDSLGSALGVAPKGTMWAAGSMEDGPFARLLPPLPDGKWGYVETRASTVTLALVAAALRARAALTK